MAAKRRKTPTVGAPPEPDATMTAQNHPRAVSADAGSGWVADSPFVIRRNQVSVVERHVGGKRRLVMLNAEGAEIGAKPEEWTTKEGKALLKAMLDQQKTYRKLASALKKNPILREVRDNEGEPFRPDPQAVQPLSALPDRVLSMKRSAAGGEVGKKETSSAAARAARILASCAAHADWSDQRIANALALPRSTVNRVRRKNLLKSKS